MLPAKIFDRKGLLERLGGAEDFVDRLVEKFVDSVAEQLPCLGEALSRDDAASINYRAHTICGADAKMGAPGIREIAARMETLAKAGEMGDLLALHGQLLEAFEDFKSLVAGTMANDGASTQ